MKYRDVGFRAFYNNFIAVPMKEDLKSMMRDFPGMAKANYILTYGYIDHAAGLTLEILAAAIHAKDGFTFADTNLKVSAKIRISSVINVIKLSYKVRPHYGI